MQITRINGKTAVMNNRTRTQNQTTNNSKKINFGTRIPITDFSPNSQSDMDYLKWFFNPVAKVFTSFLSKAKKSGMYEETIKILEENGINQASIEQIEMVFDKSDFKIKNINKSPLQIKFLTNFSEDSSGLRKFPFHEWQRDYKNKMIRFNGDLNISGQQKNDFIYKKIINPTNKTIASNPNVGMCIRKLDNDTYVVAKSYPDTGITAVFPLSKNVHTFAYDSASEGSYPIYNDMSVSSDNPQYKTFSNLIKGVLALAGRK